MNRDAQLIRCIASQLVGIQFDDLTTAERNIAKFLINFSYLKVNEVGEMAWGEETDA